MASERVEGFALRELESAQTSLLEARRRLDIATKDVPATEAIVARALHDCHDIGLLVLLNPATNQYERVDPGYSERTIEIGR